jgi:hypothetical protein
MQYRLSVNGFKTLLDTNSIDATSKNRGSDKEVGHRTSGGGSVVCRERSELVKYSFLKDT